MTASLADVGFARSFDGTMIATRSAGSGDGIPLLLCSPPGAPASLWAAAIVDLVRQRRVLAWDLRGTFESSAPVSDRLDPAAHAADALAALDRYRVDRFTLASWSTAGRIAVEIAARHPDRVTALALISGGFGHSPAAALRYMDVVAAVAAAAGLARHLPPPLLQAAAQALGARPEIVGILRQAGLVSATADTDALVALVRGAASCDPNLLLATVAAVASDSAVDLLPSVAAPTLVVAGDRDPFTPARMIEEMAVAIPRCRIEIYDGATHFLPVEYPGRLSADVRALIESAGG